MTDLQTVPIANLAAHPDNPRLRLREDVVERIAAEIGRFGFGREHALLVRPKGGAYQILSGHHRVEAAKRAALTEVPCWVKDLDDDEAFMQLVLANAQGELSPLEIGMHALGFKRGGQSEYAARTGYTKGWVSQVRSAAAVASKFSQLNSDLGKLIDKATHLYEISRAEEAAWPLLVDRLLTKGWSVNDTGSQVDKVRKFDIPAEHACWLPYATVVEVTTRVRTRVTVRVAGRAAVTARLAGPAIRCSHIRVRARVAAAALRARMATGRSRGMVVTVARTLGTRFAGARGTSGMLGRSAGGVARRGAARPREGRNFIVVPS